MSMDAIQFIEQDLKRGKKHETLLQIVVLSAALLFPVALGIGLRRHYAGALEPRVFIPNLVATFLLGGGLLWMFRSRFSSARIFYWAMLAFALGLILATERVFFPVGERTFYASSDVFWGETGGCFLKGAVESLVLGAALSFISFKYSAWPSRRWRALISVAIGVSGAVMLGFHCDSSSPEHVLIGHVGQGVFTGLIAFFFQNRIFASKMKTLFPTLKRL